MFVTVPILATAASDRRTLSPREAEYIRAIKAQLTAPIFINKFAGEKISKRRRVVIMSCPLPLISLFPMSDMMIFP
jgi:hypothetical protein